MSVIGSNILAGASGNQGYFLTNSLRFRSSASAYLNRTPASAGNRQTWTWSAWVKRGSISGTAQVLFSAGASSNECFIGFTATERLGVDLGFTNVRETSAQYRDPSAWYHIVVAVDTTNATAQNRCRVYINGVEQTAFLVNNTITQNASFFINNTTSHEIGRFVFSSANYFDGYLAEYNFIDGQALTPSSFGETSTSTGVWIPKKYTGTYGTNGFYLPFTDNSALTTSSNVGLGKDFSGNGNYWTTNNISITSGATYDSMTDVPTLTSATTANYCVINPLRNINTTITSANLNVASPSSTCGVAGTFAVNTGKWYWEVNCISNGTNTTQGVPHIGIIASDESSLDGSATNMYLYRSNGDLYTGAGYGQTGLATYTNGDVIGVAYDAGANSLQFYKNNTAVGTPISTTTNKLYQPYWLVSYVSVNSSAAYNFGQRPFTYTPPTGFVALNTFNLPTPTIGATASSQANKYMDATTYTGNGGTQSVTNSGSMQPDFLWIKPRSTANVHVLSDSVRGTDANGYLFLASDLTNAESTFDTTWHNSFGKVTALNSNGFTVVDGSSSGNVNTSAVTYVGWQWRASNATAVSNTAGSITSTVSANTTAGFSVVTYTGTGSNATVGHGLGVAPSMLIIKARNTSPKSWMVGISSLSNWNNLLQLNTTDAVVTDSTVFNGTAPTSSVFSIGTNSQSGANGTNYVAYCFAQIAGYSAFGSYTGNGSTDGTFVFLGFRPRFIMVKRTDAAEGWEMLDTSRNTYNAVNSLLEANLSNAEITNTSRDTDFTSNGFKVRNTSNAMNASGGTYIYMAFAENPFKYSNAQ